MTQIPNTVRQKLRRTIYSLQQGRAVQFVRPHFARAIFWATSHRVLTGVVALVIIVTSIILPVVQGAIAANRYYLGHDKTALLDGVNKKLEDKLDFDAEKQIYHFNQAGAQANDEKNPLQKLQQSRVGDAANGKQLYSVDLAKDLTKGITYYDNQQDLQFTMTPTFATYGGEKQNGRVVYPLKQLAGQAVYTIKNNGLKEDILLDKVPENGRLDLEFSLHLPKTLEARMIPNSNDVGIYAADPTLFGNISYGSDDDQQRVVKARENSPKNYLTFVIPAPVIKQTGKGSDQVGAAYTLDGNTLHLSASNLDKATYPLTVDPSVVVTSSSDFTTNGNNDGNIDITSNQVSRGALSGGTLNGGWASTSSAFTSDARYYMGSAVYNGYLYMIDGRQNTTNFNDYMYAPINSNGTVGTWTEVANTTTSGSLTARYGLSAVAYNGYMYMLGGYDGTSTYYNEVWSASINSSTGALGSWTQTSAFSNARYALGAFAYNNKLYVTTGYNGTTYYGDLQYANINADGSIGSWTTSATFINGSNAAGGRFKSGVVVYNGYIYVAGGQNGGTFYNQVWFTKISNTGDIGAWAQTAAFTNTRYSPGLVAVSGYLYVSGGNHDGSTTLYNDVQVAPINTNGTVGTWRATASFSTIRYGNAFFSWNGYMYIYGGANTGGQLSDTQYAAVDSAGAVGAFASSSPTITTLTAVRAGSATVAYNGYIYVMGGQSTSATTSAVNTIYRATIGADGGIGSWTLNATNLPGSYTGLAAVAYNNKMYILGGLTSASAYLNTVSYATITLSTGATGSWTTSGNTFGSGNTRAYLGAVVYNNYLYAIGGSNGSGRYSTVYKSAMNTDTGVPGAFATTSALNNANSTATRDGFGLAVSGGRVYVLGGYTGSTRLNDIQYASFNTDGTLSSWSIASTTFTTARERLIATASNGYLYILGGYDGTNYKNDVQYAPILSTGNIGSWVTNGTTFTTGRSLAVGVAYNGWIYVGAGQTGTSTIASDMQAAPIGNGGAGSVNAWSTLNPLYNSDGRFNHGAVAVNGYLYVMGGNNGTGAGSTWYDTVANEGIIYAPINNDGTLGTWAVSSDPMPTNPVEPTVRKRQDFGITAYNGYIYITGGDDGTYDLADTEYIKVNSDGTLGTWAAISAGDLPGGSDAYFGVKMVAYNGYLYATGGVSTTYKNIVRYVALGATGDTTGSWTATSAFATPRYEHAAVAYGGYLYVLGGTDDVNLQASVQYAPINANGSLGTFVAGPHLSQPRKNFDAVAQNGFLYVVGGYNSFAGSYTNTEVASINANGSLSGWTATSAFATPRAANRVATYGGYIFNTGGVDDSTNYSLVQGTQLNAINRTGTYSKMIDLGAAVALPTSITYNGSLPSSFITYQLAGSAGTWGSTQVSTSVTTPSCASSLNNIRYIWIQIAFDDSLTGLFGDSTANNAANVTDITFNYNYGRAPTNIRMHGGKYFAGNTQAPLDTCGL